MPTKDRLRALRLEANRTQIQIAKLLHIEGRTYQRLELEELIKITASIISPTEDIIVGVGCGMP